MIKYLNSLQYLQSTINVDKITSLQALIVVKCCRLASIMDPRNDISLEQKSQLINTDTRDVGYLQKNIYLFIFKFNLNREILINE